MTMTIARGFRPVQVCGDGHGVEGDCVVPTISAHLEVCSTPEHGHIPVLCVCGCVCVCVPVHACVSLSLTLSLSLSVCVCVCASVNVWGNNIMFTVLCHSSCIT